MNIALLKADRAPDASESRHMGTYFWRAVPVAAGIFGLIFWLMGLDASDLLVATVLTSGLVAFVASAAMNVLAVAGGTPEAVQTDRGGRQWVGKALASGTWTLAPEWALAGWVADRVAALVRNELDSAPTRLDLRSQRGPDAERDDEQGQPN